MPLIRLPLAMPFEPRDPTLAKDSLLVNMFPEQSKTGTAYVEKRPGFVVGYSGTTTPNLGIFYYNGVLYQIDPDDAGVLLGWVPPADIGFGFFTVISDEDFV
jgi:hypothetical protein